VLGYLDDLLLVPLGVALVVRLVPAAVMTECRALAAQRIAAGSAKPMNWVAGAAVVAVWLLLAALALRLLLATVA
jgi:uncharacterized membrane protein YkvA (DUF1232 family)